MSDETGNGLAASRAFASHRAHESRVASGRVSSSALVVQSLEFLIRWSVVRVHPGVLTERAKFMLNPPSKADRPNNCIATPLATPSGMATRANCGSPPDHGQGPRGAS